MHHCGSIGQTSSNRQAMEEITDTVTNPSGINHREVDDNDGIDKHDYQAGDYVVIVEPLDVHGMDYSMHSLQASIVQQQRAIDAPQYTTQLTSPMEAAESPTLRRPADLARLLPTSGHL